MTNKKLIFIVSSPRSGSTLLLSFLCGIPNSKILYETKIFQDIYKADTYTDGLIDIAKYFDSFEEEIVIEKTPEHCFHLEDIEKLRGICKRDIYVVYVVRPPVPTILSLIKASKDSPELFGYPRGYPSGNIDLLGACEKYEESLMSIYNNLILKTNEGNKCNVKKPYKNSKGYIAYRTDSEGKTYPMSFTYEDVIIPYSFCISYRELIEDSYRVLNTLLTSLYLKVDIQSLIDNRISNVEKYLLLISTEKHHVNVLRDIEDVEAERRSHISKQITEGLSRVSDDTHFRSERYIERSNYIRNYFEHTVSKETIYDLVVNKKLLEINKNPLVTTIVPLYNKEKYIRDTLDSLLYQTYENLRVVVINDASTDKSLEIVNDYISSLPLDLRDKIRTIHYGNNQGVSYIRNVGLSLKKNGDILSFCDADDIWDKSLVEKSVEVFTKYPYVDCVYSRVLSDKCLSELITKIPSKICNGNVFNDAIKYNFLNCGSNLFIKRQVIEDNDIQFDLAFNGVEDWDFLIQLSKVAVFKCTKEYLVTYRQIDGSLSSNRKNQLDQGKTILTRYINDEKEFSRPFTRLFLYYLSLKNLTWENIRDLDFRFILETVLDKLKSFVKSYIS